MILVTESICGHTNRIHCLQCRILQTLNGHGENSQYENMNAIFSYKVSCLGNAIPISLEEDIENIVFFLSGSHQERNGYNHANIFKYTQVYQFRPPVTFIGHA